MHARDFYLEVNQRNMSFYKGPFFHWYIELIQELIMLANF